MDWLTHAETVVLHALAHIFGLDDLSGPLYGFWSGIGSDMGEIALIGTVVTLYRRHNCHVKGCWRISRHAVGPYSVCSRHHPTVPDKITPGHIAAEHERQKWLA